MKIIAVMAIAAALAVTTGILTPRASDAADCFTPATYSWDGTVINYGLRDFVVSFCGGGDIDASAEVDVKGRKDVALLLVAPDGTVHVFSGQGGAAGEIQGPLENGDWTLIVRNLGSSRLKFEAQLSFE